MTSVLVVEDDRMFRSAIVRDLGSRGFEIQVAADVEEAIGLLSETSFDVLLTDLRLGGRDGIDLLKRTRTLAPTTRAILMSGFATARDYQRAIELGAVRVLCKPFTSEELHQAIEHARDCTQGYSGSIHGLSLIDVLQLYHFARRTLLLRVVGVTSGLVAFRSGEIVHAECGELSGERALVSLLARPSGVLRTEPVPAAFTQTIQRPAQVVLLDCLRVIDEGKAEHPDERGPAELLDQRELSRERLQACWRELSAHDSPAPKTVDVVGLDLDVRAGVQLAGVGDPETWTESLHALVGNLASLSDSRCGVAQIATEGVLIAVIWELDRRFAFLLTDVVNNVSTGAWFRAFATALARGVVARPTESHLAAGPKEASNGQDR